METSNSANSISFDSFHKKPGKVLCFGELLFRISPDGNGNWLTKNTLPLYVGGAELNAATALAQWGIQSAYLTALPDNFITHQILQYLTLKKIDACNTILNGNRIGVYYLPQNQDMKNHGVIYDRANSSFSELKQGSIDWDAVFEGVSWFHFTAISPALNTNVAELCEEAVIAARHKGITVSVDLNYRQKLWKYGKQPSDVMPGLVKYCDLVMGNIWAAEKMLGIPLAKDFTDITTKENYLSQSKMSSWLIMTKFPNCKAVANTFRFDKGENGINYFTTLYSEEKLCHSKEYAADKIVDKVGSGDCFMAGLIYGVTKGLSANETLEYATKAAFDKLFIEGDSIRETQAMI